MNEDLQATLEWLKECGDNDYLFETGNSKMLLDYITNLQETIDFQDKWLEYYKDFISENNIKDYKSRIEKAIEHIEKNTSWSYDENCDIIGGYQINDLLNILNGRSDE